MNYKRKHTKVFALLLSLIMLFSSMGTTAFAMEMGESGNGNSVTEQSEENTSPAAIQTAVSFMPLDEAVSEQEVSVEAALETIVLPEQLEVADAEGNSFAISVTWTGEPEFDGTVSGEYQFTPVLPEGYTTAEGTELPVVKVTVIENVIRMAGENTYEVSTTDEFSKAVQNIQTGNETEYTIALQSDITLTSSFSGVPGKTILIRSQGDTPHLLTFKEDILRLSSSLTFENIRISSHTIYASGNALILGEGFGGGADGEQRMTIYGGSDQDLTADTNVTILDGVYKLVAGGNSAGTLTGSTHVEFGGNASFPTAADGKEQGDTSTGSSAGYNLYQKAEMEQSWNPVLVSYTKHGVLPYGIYGGGVNADTTGDTEIKITGGDIYQIYGGGAAIWNPRYAEAHHKNGCVNGDTYVTVTAGEVKSIYGGGYNGIDAFGGDDYEKVPDDARSTRAVVHGTAHVTVEGTAHVPACEQSEDASSAGSDPAAVHGGSFHSTVAATEVVVGGQAKIETGARENTGYGYGSLFGAGTNDIVLQTTRVTLKDNARIGHDDNKPGTSVISQGAFGNVTPLGYAAQSRCYIGGAAFDYGSEIRNQNQAEYAATATVEGGQVDVLGVGPKSRSTKQAPKSVNGNVLLQQTGGTTAAIEASCIKEKKVTVAGNVDVKVSGGTISGYIMGKYPGNTTDGTIKGVATLEVSGSGADGFHKIPLIETMDRVTVKEGAKIAVEGGWTVYDEDGKYSSTGKKGLIKNIPFFRVRELTVEENAVLALSQKSLIEGNLIVNGQLNLKRSDGIGGFGTKVIAPVTAEGTASGSGKLLPFAGTNYGTGSLPEVKEEYVYAKENGSSLTLALNNAGATGLYVDRKNKTTEQDVWFINSLPQEQLWYYDLYYQSYSADGTLTDENGAAYKWVKQTHGQGGWAFPDNEVSISQNKFDGKQFAWDAIDGSGKETLGVHYVFDENYGPHRLSALCKEAVKDNPLKIYYRAKPHTVTYQYEGNIPQGASKVPDVVHTGYSAPVTVAANPALEGYTFSGWKVQTPNSIKIENGKMTMPNQDVVLTGTWQKIPVPEKTGGLKVSKTVTGNEGDTSRDFTFRVMLGNLSLEGKYGDMTFHKGIAEFTLKHGESKTATGLPAGIRYTVEEKDDAGYTVTKSGDIGTIEENVIAVAAFNNHKDSAAPGGGNDGGSHSGNHSGSSSGSGKPSEKLNTTPQTGDNANLTFWIAVLGVSLAGAAAILILSKKQRKKSDDKK